MPAGPLHNTSGSRWSGGITWPTCDQVLSIIPPIMTCSHTTCKFSDAITSNACLSEELIFELFRLINIIVIKGGVSKLHLQVAWSPRPLPLHQPPSQCEWSERKDSTAGISSWKLTETLKGKSYQSTTLNNNNNKKNTVFVNLTCISLSITHHCYRHLGSLVFNTSI